MKINNKSKSEFISDIKNKIDMKIRNNELNINNIEIRHSINNIMKYLTLIDESESDEFIECIISEFLASELLRCNL